MIDRNYPLSLARQAHALDISRGSIYYERRNGAKSNPNWDNCIRILHQRHPMLSRRTLCALLNQGGMKVTRHRVDKVIKAMTFQAAKP